MVNIFSEVLKIVQAEMPQQCLPIVGGREDEREEGKEKRVPSARKEEEGKEEEREDEEEGYTYYETAQLEAVVPEIIMPIAASLPQEPHVLAVDDNILERRVIETLLKASSCRVTAVESVARALDVLGVVGGCCRVKAPQINLIVTDYCMPGMTGYDLLKKVKSIPVLRDIPVVIMSSENVQTRIDSCYAEGAKEFFLKPMKQVDVKRLREHILPSKKVITEQSPLSIPIRGKRKLISSEALPSQNSDRHPRLEAVTVT